MRKRWAIVGSWGLMLLACSLWLAFPGKAIARAHEFSSTFGEKCSAEPCEGAALKAPSAIAVSEAGGDVYVLDKGEAGGAHGRVVRFDQAGAFQSEFTGPSATGTGTLSEGSSTIESALVASGAFAVGEEISAPGLPTGTIITEIPSATTLVLSQNASANELGATLSAQQRLEEPESIAVDNSCVLRKLKEPALSLKECEEQDPSFGDIYVVDTARRVLDKFKATGEFIGQITEAGGVQFTSRALEGVAVGPVGGVWVYREEPAVADAFTNDVKNKFIAPQVSLQRPSAGGFAIPGGFATDAQVNFYGRLLVEGIPQVPKWDHAGSLLREALDGGGSTGVAADQTAETAFVDAGTSIGVFDGEGRQIERLGQEEGQQHLKEGKGLAVSASSGFLYAADPAAGPVIAFGPAQPNTPKPEGESFSEVGSDHARIAAQINPRSEANEAPSEYHFQYGRCTSETSCPQSPYEASVPVPDGQLAPDFEVHEVSAKLKGLQPASTYHFRVLARNSHSSSGEYTAGEELTFTTEGAGGPVSLPDNRGFELVSPADKKGARIEPIAEVGVVQAAASGAAITYLANAPSEAEPQGYSNLVQVLSRRLGSSWSSRDIAIAHGAGTGKAVPQSSEYKFFDPELGLSAVQPFGPFNPGLSEEASESTAFLHLLSAPCDPRCYRPLVTGKSPFANVPEGTQFGEDERCEPPTGPPGLLACGPEFIGASEDLSHVVLGATNAPLTPGAPPLALYEWAGGALKAVSVAPGQVLAEQGALGLESQAARGAISSDGSRIAWEGNKVLYERDTARGESVQLDAAQAGCGACEGGGGRFQIQSADGQRVIFTDTHPLTEDSAAGSGKADLYECLLRIKEGELACELSDLTPKHGGEAAEVQGGVLGASKDAGTVYFVAKGVLDEAAGARGQKAAHGQFNLYVRRDGAIGFIAALAGEDVHDWVEVLQQQPTRVSADGRYLELMSAAPLSGYDNRDRESAKPTAEVYTYDAQAARLSCASCDPSGARPVGVEYHKIEPGNGGLAGGGRGIWTDEGLVAANVPGWTQILIGPQSRYQPAYLTDSGRLFFNSINALVPQDANATQDVYQYEPPGVGSCSSADPTYSARSGGCVSLISSGGSSQESAFLGASESGDDVFFLTSAELSPLDVDSARDVYDAHVCSDGEPCITFKGPEPPPCNNESSCKASPTPQPSIFATPASASFEGPGNQTPPPPSPPPHKEETRAQKLAKALRGCHAKKAKPKRKACEKQARKRYGAKGKAKKSTHHAKKRAGK